MKKFEIIWKVVFIVMLITSVVLFILDGNHLAAWVVNAVLWCFMLWEMFNAICDKLDAIAMGIHAILFGKVEEVVIKKKADDETKAESEPEQKYMTIETKYNIGDEVWWYWLGSCVPAKGKILSFRGMDRTIYAHISHGEGLCYIEINRLFPTKEELLKSL